MKTNILCFILIATMSMTAQTQKNENKKVVILLAHPNMEASVANKAMIQAISNLPQVTVIDLYSDEEQPFQIEKHKALLTEASAIVYQFPFYWASAPSELKRWTDEVFMLISKEVREKTFMVATTTASEYDAYRSGGRNQFTMDELLRPYQVMAIHTGMKYQTPFVLYGVASPQGADNVKNGAVEYRKRIEQLLK